MKRVLNFILIIFMLFSSINLVYSANLVCCYNTDLGISVELGNLCPSGTYDLGKVDTPSECDLLRETRLGCQIQNTCYSTTPQGDLIYDLDQVLGLIDTSSCTLIDYDSNDCSTPGGDYVGDVSEGEGNYGEGIGDIPDNLFNDSVFSDIEQEYCANGGGLYGLFTSKESCESINIPGNSYCVYNPHLAGNFVSSFPNLNQLGLFTSENSCVVNTFIQECSDYSTPNNCASNIANLSDSCRWVPAANYSENYIGDTLGMCVSEDISSEKYFKNQDYYFRGNLIKNPSFEYILNDWSEDLEVRNDDYAPSGKQVGILSDGQSLIQEINGVSSELTYATSLMIKTDSLSTITLNIGSFSDSIIVNPTNGIYKKIEFSKYSPSTSNPINIKFSISGGDVSIDSLSFEPSKDFGSATLIGSSIFKPLEIIRSEASACGLCYDPLKLNLCTQKKSDLLGDCSYMVESTAQSYGEDITDDYFGSEENIYLLNKPWESQSLPNSQLFCEIYTTQTQCTDSENYVNKNYGRYHQESGDTLCVWNDNVGCYKDSNGDEGPDTRNNQVLLSYSNSITKNKFASLENYSRVSTALKDSDFKLGCDIIPPNSYMYFTGLDLEGNQISPTQGETNLIGDLKFSIQASDIYPDACKPFDITKKLYIDYSVNGESGYDGSQYYGVSSNLYNQQDVPIKDFFTARNGSSLIVDGENSIDVVVKDQSGNVGKVWNFDMNIDISGPQIDLISPSEGINGWFIPNVIGPNQEIKFSITDTSNIKSCDYKLYKYVPNKVLDSSDLINVEEINSSSGEYTFKLPINETDVSGDAFTLTMTCSDMFNQESSASYKFIADFSTDLVLNSPLSFKNKNLDYGYLNSEAAIVIFSSESSLDSCSLNFESMDSSSNLNNISSNLNNYDLSNYLGGTFKNVITGSIDFTTDGFHNGTFSCVDGSGSEITEAHSYYYDTVNPELLSYNLIGNSSSVYVDSNGNSYLRKVEGDLSNDHNSLLNVTLDGTGTWISNDFDLKFISKDGIINSMNPILEVSGPYLNENKISSVDLSILVDNVQYNGIDLGDNDLREMKFDFTYSDKAGNSNNYNLSYFLDTSTPNFLFKGDVYDIDPSDSLLFTNMEDPNFEVSFNTPNYRLFTCDVGIKNTAGQIKTTSFPSFSNSINFSISDLTISKWFTSASSVDLSFNCVDVYGINLEKTFTLIYDNTAPKFKSVGLENGNKKFSNIEVDYREITDKIEMIFEDTNEQGGYSCSYNIVSSSSFYTCDSETKSLGIMSGGLTHTSNDISWFSKRSKNLEESDSSCLRNENFANEQSRALTMQENLNSNIRVNVECVDAAGLTASSGFDIDYLYTVGNLIDFEFEYKDGKAYPIVYSLVEYDKISISFLENGKSSLMDLTTSSVFDDNTYVYRSTEGIDLNLYSQGKNIVYAVAFDSSNTPISTLSTELFVDTIAPVADIKIPDSSFEGKVFSNEFSVEFSGIDFGDQYSGSGLERIEVFEGNNKIFEHSIDYVGSDVDFVEGGKVVLSFGSNYFSNVGLEYQGLFTFGPTELNKTYNFTINVYDEVGNMGTSSTSVKYEDGLFIELVESSNVVIDDSKVVYVTKNLSPILNFKTSEIADSCDLYPSFDENPNIKMSFGESRELSFDLSTLNEFDLSTFDDKVNKVKIECMLKGKKYSFERNLVLNTMIPDYELFSSNGFIFNGGDYSSDIEIKSLGNFGDITCDYGINTNPTSQFGVKGTIIEQEVDFSSYNGSTSLSIQCSDLVSNVGPLKTYNFIVVKDMPLSLEAQSIKLSKGSYEIKPENDVFHIPSLSGINLNFALNRYDGVTCSYQINSQGTSLLSRFSNFFRNIFSSETKDMDLVEGVFEFESRNLEFNEGTNTLEISCSSSTDSVSEEVTVVYNDGLISTDVTRVPE